MTARWVIRKSDDSAYEKFVRATESCQQILEAGLIAELIVRPLQVKRSLEQNRKMWAMLTDISRQIPWVINDTLQYASPAEWKDLLTAYLRKDLRIARGLEGGIVVLGLRTKRMTIAQMTDLITLMEAFGTERGVSWTDPNEMAASAEWSDEA